MKAIKYYRPLRGDDTTRLAGRVYYFCRDHEAELISFENNDHIPLKGYYSYLFHLEFSDDSCLVSEYAEKAAVILSLCPENDDLLHEVFSLLHDHEKRYMEYDLKREIPCYGHAELIEIQTDPI